MPDVVSPDLSLSKQISIDSGVTLFDADHQITAPIAVAPSGAEYRYIIATGDVFVNNVLFFDPILLGPTAITIGDLPPNFSVIADKSIGFPATEIPLVCPTSGVYENVAEVQGTGPDSGIIRATSTAHIVCV